MLYVDTSVLVALLTQESKTSDVIKWYGSCKQDLASSHWCVTEFASALGLKQKTGQLTKAQAQASWIKFERLCQQDLQLLSNAAVHFYDAALLAIDTAINVRAGAALHLASATANKATGLVSLDVGLLNSAKLLKLKPIAL